MSSSSAVVCREVFDENSQPSAEEISEYAQQLGIDPDSESHLLPLAKDGLMQALPPPWKAYYDDSLQTHYYFNEESKRTQWEHPLDNVYRELVKRARDASVHDDTCASVQDLPTSEDNTRILERVETKVESDDEDFSIDSAGDHTDLKDGPKRITIGRPQLSPLSRLEKKMPDLKALRRVQADGKPLLLRNTSEKDILTRHSLERPNVLFKQQSEIIDLKMHVLSSPEEEKFSLFGARTADKGLSLTGKGSLFLKPKVDLQSPDTEKSLPFDSITKSDPPKGILRDKLTETLQKKTESALVGRPRQAASLDEDRKSVRFKLESLPDPTISPSSNSSSEQNDGHSIISAPPSLPSPVIPSSPVPLNQPLAKIITPFTPKRPEIQLNPIIPGSNQLSSNIVLSPLVSRPPLPPRPSDSPREKVLVASASEKESLESERGTSPRRRVIRPPPGEFIKPDLFQKSFQKISDLVRPGDIEPASSYLEEPVDKDVRPRSPMIPQQKNKISINLMESIESETSIDSPDKEFANIDLNDLDDSNLQSEKKDANSDKEETKDSIVEDNSNSTFKSPRIIDNSPIPQIKVPKLDLNKTSDSEESKKIDEKSPKSDSIEIKSPQLKSSPNSFTSDRSPRYDISGFSKPWSSVSTFKTPNKAVIAPLKASDSITTLPKGLNSPRLDGVILSQGKSSSDNVVVVYQFETQDQIKPIRSPIPDVNRDIIERNKADERRRLELSAQKELESIRVEWGIKERRMRAELQEEIKGLEEKFGAEKRVRLAELSERHEKEMEEVLESMQRDHETQVKSLHEEMEERMRKDKDAMAKQHKDNMAAIEEQYKRQLAGKQELLEIEHERALSEMREQLKLSLNEERTAIMEKNRAIIDALREEQTTRVTDIRHDYRAEVERLRSQHACHLEQLRARLPRPRPLQDQSMQDKYRCLKEKYARLKHDVKMSIERRNKRREMSMTTGSETEKSNSNKANQSLERCKELNETSVSAIIESEPKMRINNNLSKYNDNETSVSESNAQKSSDNNNEDWKLKRENTTPAVPLASVPKRPHRKTAVAFKEPVKRHRDRDKDAGATTDCQDSSEATTADEKLKESLNGHGRRRCFTRLKSASTSRLNYSPNRGEGWTSPLESLRQQLRKLDDLEDQFPDLACQQSYSLRYPFAELGVGRCGTPELEFVRHRAVVEREGMRRARAALRRRRAALDPLKPHAQPEDERDSTELEVALHRARALLGEKEIRLRHIERSLRHLADQPPQLIQEATTSDASSGTEEEEGAASGAVLRSLRALHADVRDIWRALDAKPRIASPESSSCNAPSTSQTRMTLSAPEPATQDNSDGGVTERAKGLRAWLQTP